MRPSLSIGQFIVLFLQQLVRVGGFAEFLVNKPVFSSERLDIFCEFGYFLCFELGKLCLLL
jgi:hypothetical protein